QKHGQCPGNTEKNLPAEAESSFRKKVPLEHSLEGASVRRKNLTRIVPQTNKLLKQERAREHEPGEQQAEGEAVSPLSKKPEVGLDRRTLGS
uniref:Uncharacterized protein n=1 Tax=Mustela putorius furo TaxID=9669 RepID=M3Z317_MUSPF